MSEELNTGVKIFIERCKSNPDEVLEEQGRWEGLVYAVFNYVEEGRRQPVLRGLTDEEIRLLFETLNSMYRDKFAARIMGHVLRNDGEEESKLDAYAISKGKQLLQSNSQSVRVSPAHNNINTLHPLPIDPHMAVTVQTSNTPITAKLKNALGIK